MKLLSLMKNNKWLLPLILIVSLGLYGFMYVEGLKSDVAKWQNEAAKLRGRAEVAENVYESQALVLEDLRIDNKKLQGRIEETDREAASLTKLTLEYKTKLDSIETAPGDTVYITSDSTAVPIDSTYRTFDYSLEGELHLSGYFQTESPYRLFIKDLSLLMQIEILLSEQDDGTWWYDIDTGSPRLDPKNIKVQVKPRPTPWEIFGGIELLGRNWTPKGTSIYGGLKKGSTAGHFTTGYMEGAGFYYGIGFTKYFEL